MRRFPFAAAPCLLLSLAACATNPPQPYAQLHEQLLTLDTHLDTPSLFGIQGWDFADRHRVEEGGSQVDIPRMVEGGLDGGFFAVYIPQGPLTEAGRVAARKAAHTRLDEIEAVVRQRTDQLEIAHSAADARRIQSSGRHFVFLSMENGSPVGEHPELLAEFYARGVRMAGPIHFRNNDLGTSSTDVPRSDRPGLTEFGRQWVQEANRLGILIDASHASDAALDDMLALSSKPIVLSHSGARAVFPHLRNIDDAHLRRIAALGGVIQVSAYPDYMVSIPAPPNRPTGITRLHLATFDQYIEHLLHVIQVAGVDHAGIGIDFDGGGGALGLEDATDYPRITERLLKEGYSRKDLQKIWGGNLLHLLDRVQSD